MLAFLNRRGLLLWCALLLALLCGAQVKRHLEHRALSRVLGNQLASAALKPAPTLLGFYLWGSETQLPNGNWFTSYNAQGPAVYLLRHGYMDDALARGVLLAEAQRLYDWKYLYAEVNNYDLRRILIRRSLRAYPDDPLVQCAAGELDLAGGEHEPAQAELSRSLELAASGAGGVQGFCHANWRSEQHLRGRLAAALTMLGRWKEADEQKALAKEAGDGAEPPPEIDSSAWMLGIVQPGSDEELRLRATLRFHDQQVAIGNQYARTHDPKLIQPWIQQLKSVELRLKTLPRSEDDQDLRIEEANISAALLRAYVLTNDWQKAQSLSELRLASRSDESGTEGNQLRDESASLLTRLAAGKKLGLTASENYQIRMKEARQEAKNYGYEVSEWELQQGNCGELSGLLESDYLPFLLRTDMFADALAKSGRELPDVLAEVRAVTQPQRGMYEDYSNGPLPQRLRAEAGL